jgi:LPS sulfotransferase NodH
MRTLVRREPAWSRDLRGRLDLDWPAWMRLRRHPYPAQFGTEMDLPPPAGPPRLWLMATTPRSGSHFLGHLLQSAEHLGCPLEYMNPMNLDLWRHRFGTRDAEAVFAALMQVRSGPTGLWGTKAHWTQYRDFPHHDVLARRGGFGRAVWLYRRDLLGQAISRVVASQTGQWIGSARVKGKARFDYKAILRNARLVRRQNEGWQGFFETEFAGPVKVVCFEAIQGDPQGECAAIATFVDAEAPPDLTFRPGTRRQSDGTAKDWAARFREMVRDEDRWVLAPQDFAGPRG